MPSRAPSRCPCGVITPAGQLCPCRARQRRVVKAEADARRPHAAARGYGAKWVACREDFLRKNPRCERCGAPAGIVHHRKPHRFGWARTDDERRAAQKLFFQHSNLMAVCQPCHDGPLQAAERRGDE